LTNPLRKGQGRKPEMNKRGKSDRLVVLTSPPNKAVQAAAVEGSSLAKGTTTSTTRPGRICSEGKRAERAMIHH
jgi:hypothetical protein